MRLVASETRAAAGTPCGPANRAGRDKLSSARRTGDFGDADTHDDHVVADDDAPGDPLRAQHQLFRSKDL